MNDKKYVLGVDYTIEEGRVVFSATYLAKKGKCCGSDGGRGVRIGFTSIELPKSNAL